MADDSERIRRRLPDYFEVIGEPWHLAAPILSAFVDDEEQPVTQAGHTRNLFHVAKALDSELSAVKAERDRMLEAWRDPETLDRCARAMFDAEIIQRETERCSYENAPHLISGYTSKACLDTAWASDGKTRGLWIDRARRVLIAALTPTQGTERPRSRVLTGMDLAHAEAVAENGHRENHAGYGCTFCGSFWNPTGWGSEWHKPGCAKVEPQATTGKECECGGKFRPDIMGETCVFCGAPKPEGRGEGGAR